MTPESILEERSKTHGQFKDNACITQEVRSIWRNSPNWQNLHPEQQLALDEIALKAARILSEGSLVDFVEPWDDISGYGILGAKACELQVGKSWK